MDQPTKPFQASESAVNPTSIGNPTVANGSSTNTPSSQTTSRDDLLAIHNVCSQFESVWRTNNRRTIEEITASNSSVIRPALLESLIRSELEMRECEPSPPSPQEFYQRFPLDTETVRRAFLSVEELKALEPSLHEVQPVSVISNDQTTPQSSVNSFEAFPTKLGSYQILSEFARGGMGILYKARHAELDRIVALKVIKSGQLASQWELSRFHNEAKAIASLDHPNIVPVFEVGEHSGFHYLAMPFVDGENLADRIRDQPLKPRAAAEIACQIAVAVNYAHEHGIIHRDLKPRNILLEDSGIVRVTDFGLAKIIHLDPNDDDSQDLTLTGQVVGTPAYMAPEQALGKPSKRSDIYAIGSVLYTLLTGRPPFQSATLLETLRQLQDVEPVEPRRFNTQIPRDLETITLKCLSKNPDSRYSTAGDLADDLKRFLDKKPIQARPVSQFEHLLRWVKRQPVVAGLITATIVSLSVGLAVSTTYYSLARRNESLARNNEQLASANLDVATATVKQYLTEVASSPELKEKGLETLRKTLLSTAQDFYQKLESQPGQSEMLQSRLADTRHSLALIRFELGEFDTSRILYDKTLESYRSLAMQFPSAVDYLRKVALVLADRAKLDGTDKLDDLKEATSVFRQVFAVTHEPIDQARVASALAHLGMHYTDIAKADDEEATYTEVETLCSEFLPKFDQLGMKTEAVELLRVFDRLALYLQHHGRFDGAEKWLLNVLELADKMAQQRPNDPTVLLVVARANKNLGLVYAKRVRHDDASLRFKAADTIFQRLTDEHPLILEYLDGQASNLMNSGGMESTRKEWSVALGLLQRALACQKKLVEKQPDSFEYCAALPIFYSTLGNVATSQGRIDEALEYLRKGIEAKDIAKAMRPNDIQFAYFGAALTNNLANAYRAQGRYEEALPIYLSVIESVRQLTERSPTVDAYSKILSIACHNLALTQTKLGDNARAIASDSEAKATIEKLLSRNPDSTDYRTLKMQIHIGLGQSNVQAFFLEDAKREFSEANMQLAKLMDSATNLTPYQNNLGMICLGLAQIAEQVGNLEESLDWSEKAIVAFALHLQSLANADPAMTQPARDSNCSSYRMKARALFRWKKNAEAIEACNKALGFDSLEYGQAARALLARIYAVSGDADNAKKAIEAIDLSLNLNFETLVDMAATIAILDRNQTPNLANANGTKQVSDPRIVELLKRAAKRDAIRFAILREAPELSEQFAEWPEPQQAP